MAALGVDGLVVKVVLEHVPMWQGLPERNDILFAWELRGHRNGHRVPAEEFTTGFAVDVIRADLI